jgi:hypothetical protein
MEALGGRGGIAPTHSRPRYWEELTHLLSLSNLFEVLEINLKLINLSEITLTSINSI